MPVNLYYTQRVRGFQQESVKYSKESVEIRLKRTKHQCPYWQGNAESTISNHCSRFAIRSRYSCGRGQGYFSPCRGFKEVEEKQIANRNNGYGKRLLLMDFRQFFQYAHRF